MQQNTVQHNTALVIEGGANRSIFSAGLLDGFKQSGFNPFDFYLGVSGGAYNLFNFLQPNSLPANITYKKILNDPAIYSFKRFLRGGHLIDIDQLHETLTRSTSSLDPLNNLILSRLFIAVTSVTSGQAHYFQSNQKNYAALLKASAALPLLYRYFPQVDGQAMTDGGIADGIPVMQAIDMGARRIVVVRSRHYGYMKSDTPIHRYIRWQLRDYPQLVSTMKRRIGIYNQSIAIIKRPPKGIEIIDVCPPVDFEMGRFSSTGEQIDQGYLLGKLKADQVIQRW